MAEFHLTVSVPGSCYCACWLTGVLEYNGAIVNVISNTCAFPAMTSQSLCRVKGLLLNFLIFNVVWIQPGEMDFNWAAARPSSPILPPLLADVQQPSGESQDKSQEQRHVDPEPSTPQLQPELCRHSLAAPSHCQVPHI